MNLPRSNKLKIETIKQLLNCNTPPVIFELRIRLTSTEAKELEKLLIAEIGTIVEVKSIALRGPLTNLHKGGGGGVGSNKPKSQETKNKISASKLDKKNTIETNAKISEALRIALNAPGMHEKLSLAQKNKTWTAEHSAAASARSKNLVRDEAYWRKVREGQSRVDHTCDEETRVKISKSVKISMADKEVIAKMKASSKARWSNDEERKKIGEKNSRSFELVHRGTGERFVIKNLTAYCRENNTYHRKVEKIYNVTKLIYEPPLPLSGGQTSM